MGMFSKAQLITGGLGLAGALASKFLDAVGAGDLGAAGISHIWKFVDYSSIHFPGPNNSDRKYGFGAAPDIASVKNQGAASGASGEQIIDHVDVVNDFMWTQSPKSSRDDVPVLFLREKKIQTNPQLNQIANNLFTMTQKVARGAGEENVESLKSMIAESKVKMLKSLGPDPQTEFPDAETEEEEDLLRQAAQDARDTQIAQDVAAQRDIVSQNLDALSTTNQQGVLAPYESLYYTKDTGFIYSLPYMEQQYKQVGNSFGDGTGANSALLGIGAALSKASANVTTGLNIADPGTYIEQPQLYSFGQNQKSYQVKFPLINTNSWNDVVRNWQLIWMLVYQNTPNRLTRDLIDPPCIYEANLEGTWYSKYAYVSQLDVSFVGATRKMTIPLPSDATPDAGGASRASTISVDTIIPDAYEVTLTIKDIFGESRNMLYHSVNQSNSKITTELAGSTVQTDTPAGIQAVVDFQNTIL